MQFGRANSLNAGPLSLRDLLNWGKEVLDARQKDLQDIVCHNSSVQEVAGGDNLFQIGMAVFTALVAFVPNPEIAPLVTLAALLTKIGIKTFCEPVWDLHNREGS